LLQHHGRDGNYVSDFRVDQRGLETPDYLNHFPSGADFIPLEAVPEEAGGLAEMLESAVRYHHELSKPELDRARHGIVETQYRNRFGTVPDTRRIDPDRLPPLTSAMTAALQNGRGLTVDEATEITGITPLPLGAVG
jgi:uncharacterized protein involved in type VI secretion and phage assembly